MGNPYTRNDTDDNIADGNVINASDLDGEFDSLEDAFNAANGHSHDGTAGEGGPITKVGPSQDITVSATGVTPSSTGTISIGATGSRFDDGWFAGTVTSTGGFVGDVTGDVTGNTSGTASALATARTIALSGDVSGSASFDGTSNVTITATVADDSHNHVTGNIDGLEEYVQDTVGAMVSSNTESGISVTYQDADGTLDFNVNDPTISLTGDVAGSATMTNLGNVSIATTIQANSVALGTDTTGNYMSGVSGGSGISVSHTPSEGSTATVSHADTSSQSSINNSGNTFIQDLTVDTFGHVTGASSATVSIGNGTVALATGSGLTGSGSFTMNQSTSETITLSHSDTSSQGSVNNSNGTVIQDITLDTFGHITSIGSANLDSRYYTESESNARYPRLLATYNTGYVGDGANGDYTYSFTAPLNANGGSSDPDSVPLIIISHNYWTFFSSQNCEYKIKEARFDRTSQDVEIVVNINGGGQTWPHTLYFQMYGIDI